MVGKLGRVPNAFCIFKEKPDVVSFRLFEESIAAQGRHSREGQ
jgi:hypothetical protein